MATQFGKNLLSTKASDWVLTNATLNSSSLTIKAGGVAYTEVTELNGMNFIPEALCVQVKAAQYSQRYKPTAFVHLQITFIDDNTFDALVPIINNSDGNKAILYPTISKYDVGVSAFKRIRYTVKSSEDIVLTIYTLQKSLNDVVLEDRDYYGVKLSQKDGLTIKRMVNDETQSEAIFNSDTLSMRARVDGQMKDCIYFDTEKQRYRLSGDVIIDGSIQSDASVTDALYAEQGDISQLTVDWLDTSKRVKRYLSNDTSDDNYIEAHDSVLNFVTASVIFENDAPLTEQLVNRYGSKLYWQKDISSATIIGGYPYIDNIRVYTTEENTGFPVIVYQYSRLVKRSINFIQDRDSGEYIPTDIFGVGVSKDNPYNGRGKILKTTNSFELSYTTTEGVVTGLYMRNDGFVDTIHRRADITVDTANKQFVISPEGALADAFTIDYTESGNTLSLTWPDGKTFKVVKN